MATKRQELIDGCFAKAADDEPLFVLRAQDASAAQTVRFWIGQNLDTIPPEKLREALACVQAMEAWPTRKAAD